MFFSSLQKDGQHDVSPAAHFALKHSIVAVMSLHGHPLLFALWCLMKVLLETAGKSQLTTMKHFFLSLAATCARTIDHVLFRPCRFGRTLPPLTDYVEAE